ncbi:DMT family transporter [Macrococcus hajekii]|uniref:DMT family transporter n=1 Tax=Macrococcus hajekii TaxID=198482 RepID=A0A4R6BJE6_9STAP|nr:DMT family transporter [Macrococcus hajekii]TDM01706.1 DMT family transporter [Macrococcus hajekii]GGB06724.1 membrane protein [Macrococcus hajekii]
MFYLLIALIIGLGIPIQTAINSRLRSYVLSPFIASFISFSVGTVFLMFVTLFTKHTLLIPREIIVHSPWWLWIGGLLGLIGLTGNILLFPKLGGVQTVILPILGQIFASMIIDHFGFFGSPEIPLSFIRIVGVILLIAGIVAVIVLPEYLRKRQGHSIEQADGSKLPYQLFGVLAGMLMATQSAINGKLGGVLDSPVHAAFISFLVGTLLLFIGITLILRNVHQVKLAFGSDKPKWILLGGIIGAFFVLSMAALVPILGTGVVVVASLVGQLICSIAIDQFGWFNARRVPITGVQIAGLILMIIGVVLIKLV